MTYNILNKEFNIAISYSSLIMESNLCEICEASEAIIKCQDCKRNILYCQKCYLLSHFTDNKKNHTAINLTAKSINSHDINNLCSEHNTIKDYICRNCMKTVCGNCILIGTHKGHNYTSFKDYIGEINLRYTNQ